MKQRIHNKPLPVLFFTIFVDLIGFGILIPILPQLFANPSSAFFLLPPSYGVRQGYVLLGLLIGIFPLGQFLATPILGQMSDKYGRKKILALSLAGTALSYILFATGVLTKNIPLLFFARAFDGITGGNISVAQAAIADVTPPDKRARNFGLIGAAFGLGFIFGPFLGGKLSDPAVFSWFNASTPFWFAAILSFLNVVSLLFFLPETHKTRNHTLRIDWTRSTKNIFRAFRLQNMQTLFSTIFLYQAGFSFFITFFGVFLIQRFAFTQGHIGNFFAYIGLWSTFTQGVITRFVAKKFKEDRVLRISLFGSGIAILLLFFTRVPWELYVFAPLLPLCNGLTQANFTGLVSRSVGPEIQGEILGISSSVQALAMSVPSILSGFIAATLTPQTPIIVSSIGILFAGLTFVTFYRAVFRPTMGS